MYILEDKSFIWNQASAWKLLFLTQQGKNIPVIYFFFFLFQSGLSTDPQYSDS